MIQHVSSLLSIIYRKMKIKKAGSDCLIRRLGVRFLIFCCPMEGWVEVVEAGVEGGGEWRGP